MLDRAAIAARIPHAGAMCLLEQVLAWDAMHLECLGRPAAASGNDPHPLARAGRLPSVAAIEYAAQAMALHGRLVLEQAGAGDAAQPPRGFLAGLRGVRLHGRWVGPQAAPLRVRVDRFAGDALQVLYDFTVEAGGPVAAGRAVVVLDAGARGGGAA